MAASPADIASPQPHMVHQVLDRTARMHGDMPAMRVRVDGAWRTTTWKEYREQARLCARGLLSLGLARGGVVVVFGENRPEWLLADVGAILAGGLPAGLYASSTPEQCRFVAAHCQASIAVVDNLDRLGRLRAALPNHSALVLMSGEDPRGEALSWQNLLQLGARHPEAALEERLSIQRPDDACTLIYTSGTTGNPRGVLLTHVNLTWTADRTRRATGVQQHDNVVSYLPLAHIAEQLSSIHGQMLIAGCTWFTQGLESLAADLREIRPNYFLGVPRVWERMMAAMQVAGARANPIKARLIRWARRQGIAGGEAAQWGHAKPLRYRIADRLVLSQVRRRLGLDRSRFQVTSAAPAARETLEFFLSFGIPLYEFYGLSECTGPATISAPGAFRTGAVGRALDGTEVRVTADGEVLIRGPHVFKGYYKDARASAEAIDADGWLHTGDVGTLDADGYLRIIDRKKDMIVCCDGEKVAPQPLEGRLRSLPGVAHAAVFGLDGARLGVLLTLDSERLAGLRDAAGSLARDRNQAAHCPQIRAFLRARIEELAAAARPAQRIAGFAVLPVDFTTEGGELTPTLKLKRGVLREKYAGALAQL
jgi:long-subunit acyl-CoA synthetase (AMP-forming)